MMLSRRRFAAAVTGTIVARARVGHGQPPARRLRLIAILWPGPADQVPVALVQALRQGLHAAGWSEGRDLKIEQYYVERPDRLRDVIGEMLRTRPDVVVTPGTPITLAMRRATTSVPVVMVAGADPVATGLVSNLAHPGGNVTGLIGFAAELGPKSLELIRELLPKATRVAALWNAGNPGATLWWRELRAAAPRFGLTIHTAEFRTEADLDAAFQVIEGLRPEALTVGPDPVAIGNRIRIVEFVARHHLPAVYAYREFVTAGGLMAYTNNLRELFARAAGYVDKILRGTPPGELPIQQPTKFELVVNVKTANALRLAVPDSLIVRADEIIE